MLIAVASAGVLWLSHRLHTAYVAAVAREERTSGARTHIGPRCFLVLDLVLLLGLLLSLDVLAFDRAGRGLLFLTAIGLTRFSVLVALWLLLERRHLERFYGRLARFRAGFEARPPRQGLLPVHLLLLGLALVPMVLEALGLDLAAIELPLAALLFLCFFLLPQLGLLALSARRLQPLRRAIHDQA
ncbi:MAG: hypothetical protein H6807_17965 [Planctomycetes bacterium]|nr:hypothetical protein [Planctomycetota bacterium]